MAITFLIDDSEVADFPCLLTAIARRAWNEQRDKICKVALVNGMQRTEVVVSYTMTCAEIRRALGLPPLSEMIEEDWKDLFLRRRDRGS